MTAVARAATSDTATLTFTSTGAAAGSTGGAAAASLISCTVKADNPHTSTHVPETVNFVTTTTCDSIVQSITTDTKLYRGVSQVGSGHNLSTGTFTSSGNAASQSCVNGQYLGTATVTVVPPIGYAPSSATANVSNGPVPITC